jgi:beta-glucosidase/6-phospho-beta-glucosidase/beta-galactosidase
MKIEVGIEGTFAPQCGKDTLEVTGHYRDERWQEDLKTISELGIRQFRYPIPWHRLEREPGQYDWQFLDQLIPYATEELGLSIIADPLHHTSYPKWLTDGFLDERFVSTFCSMLAAFAERYPTITTYAPFNEPTCTLDFCGLRGFWHPYAKGDDTFVKMLRNTALAVGEGVHRLRAINPNVQILHVDTFERHAALDEASVSRANFLNERRFLFEELVTGKVDSLHPLRSYLLDHGFTHEALTWHLQNPIEIHERGGNYYPLSEEQLLNGQTHHAPSHNPVGMAAVIAEYAERLPYPLSLTETNIQGTVRDRISWLKYTLEQAEQLSAQGISLLRFTWFPLFDCAGWNCLLQDKWWKQDPQGVLSCERGWQRRRTEFTDCYGRVARGARSATLPAYRFTSRHERTLGPFIKELRWDWQNQ